MCQTSHVSTEEVALFLRMFENTKVAIIQMNASDSSNYAKKKRLYQISQAMK